MKLSHHYFDSSTWKWGFYIRHNRVPKGKFGRSTFLHVWVSGKGLRINIGLNSLETIQ